MEHRKQNMKQKANKNKRQQSSKQTFLADIILLEHVGILHGVDKSER